ncbi:MAG: phosphonate ABC transporter, permease protein PhnE [Bradyrhizobiaceae bacterium]|nr:phosphonate ABC transporter, permease protein PhnE [Hyphomicrobiales bacterium]MBV9428722.1 phosphonate ABC transporter, permease protein PhnE [Bradyrhizobiaceae bacterium]
MVSGLLSLPQERVDQLLATYARAVARRRRQFYLVLAVLALLATVAGRYGEVDLAYLLQHFSNFTSYFGRILPTLTFTHFAADMADWYWNLSGWLKLLVDTILIAYLGTLIGTLGAFATAFLTAQNTAPNPYLLFAVKRFHEFCRTVPDIVFALLFVAAFGLGPLPGILAIGIHSLGTLGKLFTEVVENIDMKPVEGVRSTGGNFVETVRFAVVPQVLANFASYALLRFEINVRSGTVIGFVGAGGIGQDLFVAIRKFYYTDVSAILLMIIVTVVLFDLISERIRHHLARLESDR